MNDAFGVRSSTTANEIKLALNRTRLKEYAGCYNCYLPTAWCNRWEAEERDEGSRRRIIGGECQYPNLLFNILVYLYSSPEGTGEIDNIVRQEMKKVGVKGNNRDMFWGKRIKVSGIDMTGICRTGMLGMDLFKKYY